LPGERAFSIGLPASPCELLRDLPAGAAILATYLTMRLLFRRTLQGEVPNVLEDLRLSTAGKLTVLGVIAIAGVLLFCSANGKSLGAPTCITAFAITLFITLWDRQAPLAVARGVSCSVLPLVAGLFVIVEALDSADGLQLARNLLDKLTEWPPLAANLATAFAGRSFPRVHFSAEGALPGRTEAISYQPVPNIAERIPPNNSESITEYRSCNQPMSRSLNMDRRLLVPASSDSICSLS
jgi:hypothetical protein